MFKYFRIFIVTIFFCIFFDMIFALMELFVFPALTRWIFNITSNLVLFQFTLLNRIVIFSTPFLILLVLVVLKMNKVENLVKYSISAYGLILSSFIVGAVIFPFLGLNTIQDETLLPKYYNVPNANFYWTILALLGVFFTILMMIKSKWSFSDQDKIEEIGR
jgi:hypothetical protein